MISPYCNDVAVSSMSCNQMNTANVRSEPSLIAHLCSQQFAEAAGPSWSFRAN